ncbi:MAG TPA: response regulator transcription factor [Nitratifractor sp.]|nr:response regulator transcription factor [Nitratifractor sp.]HHH20535.1 response regulator transcription factor [Nitratifractor sp.]
MYNVLQSKNVLYVEDDKTVRENIKEILNEFFKKVITAESGEDGWLKFKKERIDLAIVDIELPGFNGLELIKRIRKERPDLPVIVVSAYTKTDYLLESVELKLDKYIVKPLTSRKLYELLMKLEKELGETTLLHLPLGVTIDTLKSNVSFAGQTHALTYRELKMMQLLSDKGAVTYEDLYQLWREIPTDNAIRSFVKQLRKKLPDGLIKVRSKIGYVLEGY